MQTTPVTESFFLDVKEIIYPKNIHSLVDLWHEMMPKQLFNWKQNEDKTDIATNFQNYINSARKVLWYSEGRDDFLKQVSKENVINLYGIVRAIHFQTHLQEIDYSIKELLEPMKESYLHAPLVLQTFLDYLKLNGVKKYEEWVNSTLLRLVSTVHPNETERNSNLRHYAVILDKYLKWRQDNDSLKNITMSTPIYRSRREDMNQLRRAIKAEIESLWQSDQMRSAPIMVDSEAQRILERYNVIIKSFPPWVKFIKFLNAEAFWRYEASVYVSEKSWRDTYVENINFTKGQEFTRTEKLHAIKQTFRSLKIDKKPPRITAPIISFGTWKGGDRDGNPFVIASFSNQVFLDHKEYILKVYLKKVKILLDAITPSEYHVAVSEDLKNSLQKDLSSFPYIQNIKLHEPYRLKLRYMNEKLENTLNLVKEVKKRAGATVKPLLGQSLPGPTGYSSSSEFTQDVNTLYKSLTANSGKSQARSMMQDLQILSKTFGFHTTPIDFRQLSTKNLVTVTEYLQAIGNENENLEKVSEENRITILLDLICNEDIEFKPFVLNQLSQTSKDTLETLIIFSDASRTDETSVGKFIISMCSRASDILIVYFLLKIVGILQVKAGKIVYCPYDVTGLFETIADMKSCPKIIKNLFSIDLIRDFIVETRGGNFCVMLGYSDSVRDGSSLASDAQINRTSLILRDLQNSINEKYKPSKPISLNFYRGRGDTIPRGFGGSIDNSILSQVYTTKKEDHTEQNRYLRRYFSPSSATDHYHRIYSAHMASQIQAPNPNTELYQRFFDLLGKISYLKYSSLVKTEDGGRGDLFFQILDKYSILSHLPKSYFASRPVARGREINIDAIRAIPYVMVLSQMRDFSSAFYGTGTSFDIASSCLENFTDTTEKLIPIYYNSLKDEDKEKFKSSSGPNKNTAFSKLIERVNIVDVTKFLEGPVDSYLQKILSLSASVTDGVEEMAYLMLSLNDRKSKLIDILKEMYKSYSPFTYSIENKESALLIRQKEVVDLYTQGATTEEKQILDEIESEAQLTLKWLLQIMSQENLVAKHLKKDVKTPELYLLHVIQSHFMKLHRAATKENDKKSLKPLDNYIQMSILAISEGLGFGG